MLTHYFGFTKDPFARNVPAQELFISKDVEHLKKRLNFFLNDGGIFLLTGSIGAGKTCTLKSFADSINPAVYQVIYISGSFDTKKDFYRTLLMLCSITPSFFTGDCRNIIRKHFLDMQVMKKQTLLVILDESQNFPAFILEEIRLLTNFDFDSISPALFILSGHRLLKQRMSLHENEALRQRLSLQFHLDGFSLEETCAYISHRLEKAGSSSRIFSDSVIPKIHEESMGIPRLINKICKALLLSAVISEKKTVDEYLFEQTRGEW